MSGKIGIWASTLHQPFRLVLSQEQLAPGELLVNRSDNPATGDIFAPRGGFWLAEDQTGQTVLNFTIISAKSASFAQVSYRLRLNSGNPKPERILGIGDTVTVNFPGLTAEFPAGPVTGTLTKAPLVYRNLRGDKERVFVEIMPVGSSKPLQAIVEVQNGLQGSLQASGDLRGESFDTFQFQEQETDQWERRLWTDSQDLTYVANESAPSIRGIFPNAPPLGSWLFNSYSLPQLDQLFGAGTRRWWFADYFMVPKNTVRQQETLLIQTQVASTENPNLFFFYDRVIEVLPFQGQQAEIRFDRGTFQPHLATLGKLAATTSFSLMAVQVNQEGGNYTLSTYLPNAFLISQVPEFQNGTYTAFPSGAWNWDFLVKRGDTLPGGEKVETLSPAFSRNGPCSVSFHTLTGGFNGKFNKRYDVGIPCINSPTDPVPSGSQFEISGDNLTFPSMSTKVYFDGGQYELPCSAISRTKLSCVLTAVRDGQTYPLESVGKVSLYVSVKDDKGNESRSPIFRTTLAPPLPPTIASVVNGADFKVEPLSPNAWFTVFGSNFGQFGQWTDANTFSLGGASVTVCGLPAAISYNSGQTVNGSQINALMPDGVAGQSSCPVIVSVNGQSSQPVNAAVALGVMELFTYNSPTGLLPIVTHSDYSLVGSAGLGTPAQIGEIVIGWGTGDCATKSITVNGKSAAVQFSGRVGPGLCQVNFVVPGGLTGGSNDLRLSNSPSTYQLMVK